MEGTEPEGDSAEQDAQRGETDHLESGVAGLPDAIRRDDAVRRIVRRVDSSDHDDHQGKARQRIRAFLQSRAGTEHRSHTDDEQHERE